MDKFVDSFSRGLKKTKIPPTKVKKSGAVQGTQHQMFLDLGQKLFGKNKECMNCGMFFVIGDVDDERRHDQICAKVIYDIFSNSDHKCSLYLIHYDSTPYLRQG